SQVVVGVGPHDPGGDGAVAAGELDGDRGALAGLDGVGLQRGAHDVEVRDQVAVGVDDEARAAGLLHARDAARLREEVPEGLGQVRHQVGERVDELAADLDVHGDDARAYRVDDVDRVLLVLEPGRGGVGRLHRALGGHV